MRIGARSFSAFVFQALAAFALAAQTQPETAPVSPTAVRPITNQERLVLCPIVGRVTTMKEIPVSKAKVVLMVEGANDSARTLETNINGEFQIHYRLDAETYKSGRLRMEASKAGYREARETSPLASGEGGAVKLLVLRDEADDPDVLSEESLFAELAPPLRVAALSKLDPALRVDLSRGAQELLDSKETLKAEADLAPVLDRRPDCSPCRALFGLALLKAGSWEGARRELRQASAGNSDPAAGRGAEPMVALGTLETWRNELQAADELFRKALELAPSNPLALQEHGRVLLLEDQWAAGDEELKKAIAAGASQESHLLRARATLAEGDVAEANREMDLYVGNRRANELPTPLHVLFLDLKVRLRTATYGETASLLDRTPEELQHVAPELEGLEPAKSQKDLPRILAKLGEYVEGFFINFANTISSEDIEENRLRPDGRTRNTVREKFQYILVANRERIGMGLTEVRKEVSHQSAANTITWTNFMRTKGFASSSILFHPSYQRGTEFLYLGRQVLDGKPADVVAFAQIPGRAPVIDYLSVSMQLYPLLLQGFVWVDPETSRILRLRTEVLQAPPKSLLTRHTTEVIYGEVRFPGMTEPVFLPQEVVVSVEWKGHSYRNRHRYSDFRLFGAESTIRVEGSPLE